MMSVRSRADSEIDQLYNEWGEAFQHKNIDAILGLLAPDYVLWPAGAPACAGGSQRWRGKSAVLASSPTVIKAAATSVVGPGLIVMLPPEPA